MSFDIVNITDESSLEIYKGNNLDIMSNLSQSFRLIYMDPPFNTGRDQTRKTLITKLSADGDRKGFKGKMYTSEVKSDISYSDTFDNLSEFLYPRIEIAYKKLTPDGSMAVHLDYREVHDVKIFVMDKIFGRECFMNEIIWEYDYGARSRSKWSAKHDTILWYVKDPKNYIFNFDSIDRIPYLAPGLVTKEKAAVGKTITDVWWHTIVCGKEKTGYPTQKPQTITNRFIKMNSLPGDYVMDPFAGSGTFGESALLHGRNCVLIDEGEDALKVMEKRLMRWNPKIYR